MSDGDALRRAILADPDEDTPRLIYADWLEENNQSERAAFIRLQIEAARAEPFGPQARGAAAQAEHILERNQHDWTRDLPAGCDFGFERGFVTAVELSPVAFLEHAAELFETEPIQTVRLSRAPFDLSMPLEPAFESPMLSRVRRLGFTEMVLVRIQEHEALASSPYLGDLRELSLWGNPVPPAWLTEMLTGEAWPLLNGLDLSAIPHLGPSLASAFARANHRGIRKLDATGVVFTSHHMQQLLSSRCLRNVEELRLEWIGRSADPGPLFHLNLGWVIPWNRLVVLDLTGQRLGNESVREIAHRPEAAALRWLGLSKNELGADAVHSLVESKHLKLNHLDVSGNGLRPAQLDELRERFPDAVVIG